MTTAAPSTPATERQIATIRRMEQVLRGSRGRKTDTTGMSARAASDLITDLIREQSAMAEEPEAEDAQATTEVVQPQHVAHLQQVTQPPATPKQLETITRLARAQGKTIDTDGLTRAQASEIISNLIGTMQERTPEQGEWPPVPPQSSEAQRVVQPADVPQVQAEVQEAQTANQPAQARASDNPFAAEGDEELRTLGDEDEAEDPELVRTVPAPVGGPFAFQIVSADWVPPKSSQYGGIRLTCVGLPDGNEQGKTANGTEAGDYLSMNPNSRWRHEALLAAIDEERCKRSQLAGHTFWATTEEDNWERTNEETGETRVIKRTRIKDYLEGPTPKPLSNGRVNGTVTPAKPVAKLGAEFA